METITSRLDRVQKIPPQYLAEVCPAPISVKIELSPRCNFRCKYCALMDRNGQPQSDMDWGLFKRITKEMRDVGVEEIGIFFIGESFMSPELLIQSIKYLKRTLKFPYVFLTSNASMANPLITKKCMKAGLNSLKWSCNAANESQFVKLMGVKKELFHRAVSNIQEAYDIRNSYGYKTKLYASSIRYDGSQHKKMESFLDKKILPYVDQHYWLPLYSMGGYSQERESNLGMTPVAGNPGRYDDPVAPLPCWLLFTSGHVMADGRLTACGYDSTGNWEVGDLKTQSFMDAWNSPEFQTLRKAHLAKDIAGTKCEKCILI